MKKGKVLLYIGLFMISIGTSLISMKNIQIGLFLLISAVVVLLFALVIGLKEKKASKN
ncbi:hypothetical protein [Myroides sp. N17-2]|uniref:hypothetical protein n=1 Tax=Myroides sp. N17-2 TaxID=2030799 RepID=UPI00130410D9|nr:hypothetical protein [Myroides sp. N17-2]